MRPVLSRSQIRAFDQRAISAGVPGCLLMENAGRGAADAIWAFAEARRTQWRAPRLDVVVLCGAGNNGGDGYVVARRLLTLGARVTVCSAVPPDALSGDAARARAAYEAVARVASDPSKPVVLEGLEAARDALAEADVAVDALLGTGTNRAVEGKWAAFIAFLNAAHCPLVSLDVPSGLDADSGVAWGPVVQASLTVTFAHPKRGLFSAVGHASAGELVTVDIGVPAHVFLEADAAQVAQLLGREDATSFLRPRSVTAHKGTSGRVAIVAGGVGKLGAARLAARGALRAGAGLVTIATRPAVAADLARSALEEMTLALDEQEPATTLREAVPNVDAFVLGPGLGLDAVAERMAVAVLERPEPVVVDADALHLVRDRLGVVARPGPRVLTPHPGEAASLLGLTTADVEADRFGAVERLADLSGAVVVLKGSRSLVAAPGEAPWVCALGSPVLATGGTGDVLSGVVAACLVGRVPRDAAALAVLLHALAGERCSSGMFAEEESSRRLRAPHDRGVLAHEVADALPSVVAHLLARRHGDGPR